MLEAWLAKADRIARRRKGDALDRVPDPPADLTPDDCVAAGFQSYGHYFVRRLHRVKVRVSFSPDCEHQAVFLEGSKSSAGASLWIDGRAAPMPVDLDGNPKTQAMAHWLDLRFSTGLITMDAQDPAVPVSLWAWRSEVGRIAMQGRHRCSRDYPVPPEGLTPGVWRLAGARFTAKRRAHTCLDDHARSAVHVAFSPDFEHQAVLLTGPDWPGALLWVDGEPVQVPHDNQLGPMCDRSADWLDNRFVYAQIGGLWDHPLPGSRTVGGLGGIRGLLIWDAVKHVQHLVLPDPTQAWSSPVLQIRDRSWRVYADGDALANDRPDRVLPIPA